MALLLVNSMVNHFVGFLLILCMCCFIRILLKSSK